MFTNSFLYTFLIFLYLHTEFRYTKCSLLSRIKNPVEHILTTTTTKSSVLPKNVYNYEPFKVSRTLWRPTLRRKASSNQAPSASTVHSTGAWIRRQSRPQEENQHTKVSAKKTYWHNFEKDEAAWPKVVLVLPSTERTTTPRKIKKTFATYFPLLNFRLSTEIATSDDQNDTGKKDAVTELSTTLSAMPFEPSDDTSFNPEEEDEMQIPDYDVTTSTAATKQESKETEEVLETTTESTTTTETMEAPRCYQCGLNDAEIPFKPTCYHIFESDSPLYWHYRLRHKVSCGGNRTDAFDPSPSVVFKGGCFKRYLDVGRATYNERGCRTMPPLKGKSLASNRFMTLERSIHQIRDGCVSSPYATLTPFSKSISLFARYHVCVCVGKYCNRGNTLHTNSPILISLSVLSCTYIAYKLFGES